MAESVEISRWNLDWKEGSFLPEVIAKALHHSIRSMDRTDSQIRAIEILLCTRLNTRFFYSRFAIGLGIMNVNGHIAASPSSFNLNKW